MNNQLAIAVPIEQINNTYAKAKSEFLTDCKNREMLPVFLLYNENNKEYFVSRWFSRAYIEKFYKNIKIIE